MTKMWKCRKKKVCPFLSLRAPDPFLLLRDPGLLINLRISLLVSCHLQTVRVLLLFSWSGFLSFPFLLQGIFPTQGSNPGLPHCRQMLYRLSHVITQQNNSSCSRICFPLNSVPVYDSVPLWQQCILLDIFLLLENLLTNPVILKCVLWERVW